MTSLTVTVGNLPPGTFPLPLQATYVYGDSIYFSNSSGQGYFAYSVSTPPSTPDILNGFTTAPISLSNNPLIGVTATAQGSFSLEYTTISPVIFTATPAASVLEPATVALLAIGLLGQDYAVWRRRQTRRLQGPVAIRPASGVTAVAEGPGTEGRGALSRHAA